MEDRYQGIALKNLLELEQAGELLLPNFQRAFEWERAKQHSLVASFVAGVPVGGILLLKGTGNDFAFKPLCYRSYETEMPEGECLYLLDGQQRISTLKSVFFDFFGDYDHWEEEMDRLWPQLQNRWFLKLSPNSEGEDPLGWELLRFDDQAIYHLPSEALAEHVVYKRILKNDSARREWFNPGFVRQELGHLGDNRNQIINALAERAAEDDLVPLYSALSEDEVPLHEVVIENVAEKRVRDLKAAVRDGKYTVEEVLGWLGGDVARYEEEGREELVEKEWQRLSNKWIRSIRGFVEAIVSHQVPRIQLGNDETVRAISIFDNMNKGGDPPEHVRSRRCPGGARDAPGGVAHRPDRGRPTSAPRGTREPSVCVDCRAGRVVRELDGRLRQSWDSQQDLPGPIPQCVVPARALRLRSVREGGAWAAGIQD